MPNLSQLSKRRQYRFLSQLVEYLETYSKRVREFFRFSFNAPAPTDGPRLYILGEMLLWEFSFQQPNQMETQARLVATTDALFSEAADQQSDSNTLLKQRLITQFTFECSCQDGYASVLCPHTAASIEFLRKRLERATTDEALEWLNSCIASPESLGKTLVESLEQDRQAITTGNEVGDDCRIVWRIARGARNLIELEMVVQRPKGRGGWTVGKRVRDPFENLPESAFSDPNDRAMMLVFENYFGTYSDGPSGHALIHILELLTKCPNVVWNTAGYPPAIIRRAEVKVELLEIADSDGENSYAPEILLDEEPVMMDTMIPLGRNCFGGIMIEEDEQLIRYFTLSAEQSKLITMLDQAVSRGALLDRESAEKFSKLLSTGKREQKFSLLIPESLAGPDVLLQPKSNCNWSLNRIKRSKHVCESHVPSWMSRRRRAWAWSGCWCIHLRASTTSCEI